MVDPKRIILDHLDEFLVLPDDMQIVPADRGFRFQYRAAVGSRADTDKTLWISDRERRRGLYILGRSGTGKSSLLIRLIEQDIKHGHGVFFLDPHGDAVNDIIKRCDLSSRDESIILLDPETDAHSFGINLLECSNIEVRKNMKVPIIGHMGSL